jgi:hypothetical protein
LTAGAAAGITGSILRHGGHPAPPLAGGCSESEPVVIRSAGYHSCTMGSGAIVGSLSSSFDMPTANGPVVEVGGCSGKTMKAPMPAREISVAARPMAFRESGMGRKTISAQRKGC